MGRWVGVTQNAINRALGDALGTNYVKRSGDTLTGTLTGADGSTWSSSGITMASGKGITLQGNNATFAAGAGSNAGFAFVNSAIYNNSGTTIAFRTIANNGDAGISAAAGTFSGLVTTPASATGSAGIRLPHGAAPTSPVNGDMWTTTAGLYVQINGSTVGPLS